MKKSSAVLIGIVLAGTLLVAVAPQPVVAQRGGRGGAAAGASARQSVECRTASPI